MAQNSTIDDSHIAVLQRVESDEFAQETNEQLNSTTTFAAGVTLTFTPPGSGSFDYIIRAECYGSVDVAGRTNILQLDVDGTPYYNRSMSAAALTSSNERRSQAWLKKVTLTGGTPTTIKIEFRSGTASFQVRVGDLSILAMRLDSFEDAEFDEDVTSRTITAVTPSWTTRHTYSYTPPGTTSGEYVVMGMNVSNGNTHATIDTHDQLQVGGTTKGEQQYKNNGSTDRNGYIYAEVLSLSAATTLLIRANKDASGIGSGSVLTSYTSFFAARIPAERRVVSVSGQYGSRVKWMNAAA